MSRHPLRVLAAASRAAARRALAAALLCLAPAIAGAVPSTFGPVIGSAVLCRSHLDNAYFYAYMASTFGPHYKHEGGAYWFKTGPASLWGATVSDIMVSDDTSELVFVGAVSDAGPDALEAAIRAASGVRHFKADATAFPVRQSRPGSKIVYFLDKSKVYCAKYKPLPPAR
ncbi:hypothetical protein [Massilia glaciei]|uniref:Uncharacterized protein n=1 Tax=Massilia glaciei TaxID=1524097 RepID=A0A2U2HI52_9BURK|nr:hypothetical protein [Massilia glaciei]PWF46022.1 hypothetical protein C7C56_017035 [Massilia glaciei]